MATYSSILAWRIPWTEEPGRLQSMGWRRVRHHWKSFTFSLLDINIVTSSFSLYFFFFLEKEMATHSSVLAWRIPGTGELGGPPFVGSHRVGHNWSDLAAAAVSLFNVKRYRRPCIQFDPWVGKIPRRRKWQPLQYSEVNTEKSHGQRRLTMSYNEWDTKLAWK